MPYPDDFRGILPGEDSDKDDEDFLEREAWDDFGDLADAAYDQHVADQLADASVARRDR